MGKQQRGDVVKSNALIEAAYKPMSLWEMRLLLACLVQIRSADKLDHKQVFSVSAARLAEVSETAVDASYTKLREAAKHLTQMQIMVDLMPDGTPRSQRNRVINVVSQCDYIPVEGRVELMFSPPILPYISDLKSRFTKFQAKWVMRFRSSYAFRIYELCVQWLDNEREFELSEFKRIMGIEGRYRRIDVLKAKVIEPALRDINKYSDIRISFGQRKQGRTVTHLQFMFEKLTPEELAERQYRLQLEEAVKQEKRRATKNPPGSG